MRSQLQTGLSSLVVGLCLSLLPARAFAQTADSAQRSSGPMIVERVKSGVVVAPDFKVTRFDGKTSNLAGVYGGWLSDQTLLIGGGGYWSTNGSRSRDLMYGGFVAGWFFNLDGPVGFGVKGLIGGGEANLTDQVTILQPAVVRGQPPAPITASIRFRRDFFIAEPEADVLVHLTSHLKLTGGVGYRLTSTDRGISSNRLRGATGSLALQIGS